MAPNLPNGVHEKQLPCFTREEVFQHRKKNDCWIILSGEVYDVTSWLSKHPGGTRLLLHYGGEDATVSQRTGERHCDFYDDRMRNGVGDQRSKQNGGWGSYAVLRCHEVQRK